jgi:antirestriction protein ArdC
MTRAPTPLAELRRKVARAAAGGDAYERVTARIVAALESGTPPWVRPFDAGPMRQPLNGLSERRYHGINVPMLWSAEYADPRWYTFKQALEFGTNVRKGEHGTPCVFFARRVKGVDGRWRDATSGEKGSLVCSVYTVFNAAQLEHAERVNAAPFGAPKADASGPDYARAADVLACSGARVDHGFRVAAYSPGEDRILLPNADTFATPDGYWSTVLHELSHWTGHKSRLDRTKGGRFGDDAYAVEELIAELSSAFLCAELGIKGALQHASYLAHWVRVLKADKYAIFTAAREAGSAANYILGAAEGCSDVNEEADDSARGAA